MCAPYARILRPTSSSNLKTIKKIHISVAILCCAAATFGHLRLCKLPQVFLARLVLLASLNFLVREFSVPVTPDNFVNYCKNAALTARHFFVMYFKNFISDLRYRAGRCARRLCCRPRSWRALPSLRCSPSRRAPARRAVSFLPHICWAGSLCRKI